MKKPELPLAATQAAHMQQRNVSLDVNVPPDLPEVDVDPDRMAPRIHIHSRCVNTIRQILRYVWDDFRHVDDRDVKQKPKDKNDDFPTLLKYLLNYQPNYDMMLHGAPILQTRKRKRNGR